MAAGGFKTFVAGEILTAADTNAFLMQGVLVFADAAARDAAITAPVEGQFAFLKDTNVLTFHDGSAFVELDTGLPPAVVSGTTGAPTITSATVIGGETYDVYTFKGDGTITFSEAGVVDLLCVGGGAGGGQVTANGGAGGGGAGGVVDLVAFVPVGAQTIDVGAGGANTTNGELSLALRYVGVGGGGGGDETQGTADFGGSGGGGGTDTAPRAGGAGQITQGNNGGTGFQGSLAANDAGGGGGGGGAVGGNGANNLGGNGGAGAISTIITTALATSLTVGQVSGSDVFFAGGGGGGSRNTSGTGGLGGGANGGTNNGDENTGGGGGGAQGTTTTNGGAGGSGVVIVRVKV